MTVYEEPVWEAPETKPKQGKYEIVLEPLTSKPNTWAKIGEYKTDSSAYQAALNLRNGRYIIPGNPKDWEFTASDEAVFAKFVGERNKAKK